MPNSIGIYQFNELGRIECRARERIAVIRPTQGYLSNLPQWYGRHVDGRGDCVLDSAIRRISLPILRSHWYRYVPYLKSDPQNGSIGSHRKLQLRWASGLWWWQTKAALVSRPTYCQQDCKNIDQVVISKYCGGHLQGFSYPLHLTPTVFWTPDSL